MKRIQFQKIRFRNFLSYGQTWQTFEFNNGLHIIQGKIVETLKSNGSGKSSLTELIPFALFGKTIKKVKKNDVVNWYNGKQCEIQLEFLIDDMPYEIRRGIKPNKLEVYCNGNQLPKLASAVDFQTQIEEEIIGMDFGTFQNLIYFSPNNTISIINASKPDKRKFLESLFDLSIYSKMLETTNTKIKANSEKSNELKFKRDSLLSNIDRLQNDIDNMTIPNLRKNRDKIKGLEFQLSTLLEKKFDIDESLVKMYKDTLDRAKETFANWDKELTRCGEAVKTYEKLISGIGDISAIEEKRSEILNEINILKASKFTDLEEDDLADDLQAKQLMKDEIAELVKEIQELDKKKAILESCIVSDDDNINVAKVRKRASVGICDSCGQEVTKEILQNIINKQVEEYERNRREHQSALDSVVERIQNLRERKEELFEKVKVEAERISGLQQDIRIKRGAEEFAKNLQTRLEDLPNTDEIKKKIEEYNNAIKEEKAKGLDAIGKHHMAEIDIERAEDDYKKASEKWEEYKKYEKQVDDLKNEIQREAEHYKELEEIADKATEEYNRKKGEIETDKIALDDMDEKIKKSNAIADYLNYIRVSLKDENVKKFAISSLIPFLNRQTNYYLSESGFPYIVSVDSWLDVAIRGLGVEEVSYGSLSGGETKCIDMAVQLACNDIASMMAKTSLNVMILDEVLDTSVDSLGVQSLLNIIRVRQRNLNGCVYVITHRNEIDEFTFDSVVRIIKEDKFSKVEVE